MHRTIATWNIERGNYARMAAILLREHAVDIALLQECDVGMERSGNRHVPQLIASYLKANYVMAIEFEEKGAGQNKHGLHCNAIISKKLPLMTHHIELTSGREWVESDQPRNGGRKALIAKIDRVYYANVHLENRTTPEKRAGEMARLLRAIDKLRSRPVLIGGDMNVRSYDEPLFDVARQAGFRWAEANRDQGRFQGRRYDWFLYRGLQVKNPRTIDASGISDHDLMLLEVSA